MIVPYDEIGHIVDVLIDEIPCFSASETLMLRQTYPGQVEW